MHPEFAPVCIISALSLLLPLPWHWRARNVATLSIIGWLFVINVVYAVDALIWGDNTVTVIPVWCDITTKLIIGANFALPTACLCICIHLEQVASIRQARSTLGDKRRRQWFDFGMCIGLPILFMLLHYVVQGHRFDIIEGYGCRPTTYYSIPSIFIVWLPPLVISIAAVIFAGIALRHFVIRRLSFAAHLQSSNAALTPSRYLRLMTMAGMEMIIAITFTGYNFWFTAMAVPIRPWTNWDDVHSDFGRVDAYPDALTPPFVKRAFLVIWWFIPVSTILFVAFFSFGKDAMDEYKKCFAWIRTNVLRMKPSDSKTMRLSNSKNARGLPISGPIEAKTPLGSGFSEPPAYSPSQSTFQCKGKQASISENLSDTQSEITRYENSPYGAAESKAIGSYADLPIPTPTTAGPFSDDDMTIPTPTTAVSSNADLAFSIPAPSHQRPATPPSTIIPPLPLTPPPANPRRLRELILVPSSPRLDRPLTYPSFDAASPRTVQPPQPFSL